MNVRELKDANGNTFSPKVSAESIYYANSDVTLEYRNYLTPEVSNLGDGTDLDYVNRTGFYRVNTFTNGPSSADSWGNLIVARHPMADTITQIYGEYSTSKLYTRSGNPSMCGGAGIWRPWYGIVLDSGFVNSNITASGFYVSSLRSLKKDIELTKINALDLVNSQQIVDFKYKDDKDETQKIGLIADDSNPLFLNKKKETVDLYNTCGILMKAVQELSEQNKILSQKVEELSKQINKK